MNQLTPSNHSDNDDFYVIPREEHFPICDTSNTTITDAHSSTPPNGSDSAQFYASPPMFAKNFTLETNLSFDDSEDVPNVSLDAVPDVLNDTSANNEIYYSYPTQQTTTVSYFVIVCSFF